MLLKQVHIRLYQIITTTQSRDSGSPTAVLGPGEYFFSGTPSNGEQAKNLHTIFILMCKIKKQIPLPVIIKKHGIEKENIYS